MIQTQARRLKDSLYRSAPNSIKITFLIIFWCFIQLGNGSISENNLSGNQSLKPTFKYLFFREDCLSEFSNFNFGYKDCITVTLCKVLGYMIILAAVAVKLPQILRLVKNKSGKGVLASTYYGECIQYIIKGCYAAHLGSSFSVYGENLFMLIQSFIIINLLWSYDKSTSIWTKVLVWCSIHGLLVFLYTDSYISDTVWKILINSQIVCILYSRIPQIFKNFSERKTGQLSFTSFFLHSLGNFVRLLTILKEVKDISYILTGLVSFACNATIWAQIMMYKKKKSKLTKEPTKKVEQGTRATSPSEIISKENGEGSGPVKRKNKTT